MIRLYRKSFSSFSTTQYPSLDTVAVEGGRRKGGGDKETTGEGSGKVTRRESGLGEHGTCKLVGLGEVVGLESLKFGRLDAPPWMNQLAEA